MIKNAVINVSEENRGAYIRVPVEFFRLSVNGKKITRSEAFIYGKIYTFADENSTEGGKSCHLSVDQLEREFDISRPTAISATKRLKQAGFIETSSRDKNGTSYKYKQKAKHKKYITVPQYLFNTDFAEGDRLEGLTKGQIALLSLIMSDCERTKNNGKSEGSARIYARILGLSEKTVRVATHTLLKKGLIYRPAEGKGVNKWRKSTYIVNKELFNYKKHIKKSKKNNEKLPKAVMDANARADRERYYALLRNEAQSRADRYLRIACKDEEFKRNERELGALQYKLAEAEYRGTLNLATLQQREKELRLRRADLLRKMKIAETDLIPQYTCKKCEDTGFLKGGKACDCYRE